MVSHKLLRPKSHARLISQIVKAAENHQKVIFNPQHLRSSASNWKLRLLNGEAKAPPVMDGVERSFPTQRTLRDTLVRHSVSFRVAHQLSWCQRILLLVQKVEEPPAVLSQRSTPRAGSSQSEQRKRSNDPGAPFHNISQRRFGDVIAVFNTKANAVKIMYM